MNRKAFSTIYAIALGLTSANFALASAPKKAATEQTKPTSVDTDKLLSAAITAYTETSSALVSDDLATAKESAKKAHQSFTAAAAGASSDIKTNTEKAAAHSAAVTNAKDLTEARKNFQDLSESVVGIITTRKELRGDLEIFRCPMVHDGFNQLVQIGSKPQNPYMGKMMPVCGARVRDKI